MLSDVQLKSIEKIFNNVKPTEEFEIMFNNYKETNKLSIIDFIKMVKYFKYRNVKDKITLKQNISLDISYKHKINNNYRVSLRSKDLIDKFLNLVHQRKNHVIYSILITQFLSKDTIELINKIKNKTDIYDIDEYDIRVRKSEENKVNDKIILKELSNLPIEKAKDISFRYKQRLS